MCQPVLHGQTWTATLLTPEAMLTPEAEGEVSPTQLQAEADKPASQTTSKPEVNRATSQAMSKPVADRVPCKLRVSQRPTGQPRKS